MLTEYKYAYSRISRGFPRSEYLVATVHLPGEENLILGVIRTCATTGRIIPIDQTQLANAPYTPLGRRLGTQDNSLDYYSLIGRRLRFEKGFAFEIDQIHTLLTKTQKRNRALDYLIL